MDKRLRINASLFYVDITDKQIYVNNPNVTGVPMAPDINNAGKAHTCGVELSIHADPLPGLDLFTTLGLLKTEIDKWSSSTGSGTIDYQGNELPYSPDYTISAGGTYRFDTGIFFGGDITAMGSYYGEASNDLQQDHFELVNMRFGYETESFDVVFWSRNLFGQEYFTVLDEMPKSGELKAVEGEPRSFGLTLNYHF